MKKSIVASLAGGMLALGLAASTACAAPATGGVLNALASESATAVEQVHWRPYPHRHHVRHCRLVKRCWVGRWGNRRCTWVRRCGW